MRKAKYLYGTHFLGLGFGLGLGGGNGQPSGDTLYADPVIDVVGAAGVISQLYTTLTGTLTYSKVSGDAAISVASDGAISTSSPIYLGDTVNFIARVDDSISGTYIEAPIEIVGSIEEPPSWTPADWADVIEWFDASDNTKVFSDSSATTQAVAGSTVAAALVGKILGATLANSTSGTQPDYVTDANGMKCLDFNSASIDRLVTTNSTIINNMTGNDNAYAIIGRFKRGPAGVSTTPVAAYRTATQAEYIRHFFGGTNTVGIQRQIGGTATNGGSTSTPVSADQWYTVSWIFTGTTLTVRVDGSVVANAVALDSASMTVDSFAIGAFWNQGTPGWAGSFAFDGCIGEMLILNSIAANDANIPTAEAYLTAKWPN